MWKCKHCTKEFKFSRATEKANHSRHCDSNPSKFHSYRKIKEALSVTFNEKLGKLKEFSVVCERCESVFVVTERELQHPEKRAYFCSRSCANSQGGKAKAKKHHSDEVAKYVTVAWRHHKKECVVCGENKIVAVHHYNEDHNDNDPKNLVPLCPTHHQYMHSKYKGSIVGIVNAYIRKRWGISVVGDTQDLHS